MVVLVPEHAGQDIEAVQAVRPGRQMDRQQLRRLGEHPQPMGQPPQIAGQAGVVRQQLQRPLIGGDGLVELLAQLMGHAQGAPDLAVGGPRPEGLARHRQGGVGIHGLGLGHRPGSSSESHGAGNGCRRLGLSRP